MIKIDLGCNYKIYKKYYPNRSMFAFLKEKLWIITHQKAHLELKKSYEKLQRYNIGQAMAKGILEELEKTDNPDWDKEYIKKSLLEWGKNREAEWEKEKQHLKKIL